jgi:hypothetical protein
MRIPAGPGRRRLAALAETLLSETGPLPPGREKALQDGRLKAGKEHRPPIPPADDVPLSEQYREPTATGRLLLASVARHVARTAGHPAGKDVPVTGVKVYLAEAGTAPAEDFHRGRPPDDPTLYAAYYMGDYTPDGVLKESCLKVVTHEGRAPEVVQDPFLYWRLPIVRVRQGPPPDPPAPRKDGERPRRRRPFWTGEGELMSCVLIHAGDGDMEALP